MLQLPEHVTNERQYNIVTPSLIGWTHTQNDPCIAGAAWGTTPWCVLVFLVTGGRLNKKDGLTRYGDSHVKDKTS